MKKSIIAVIMCVGLIFAFTACGSDSDSNSSSSNVSVDVGSLVEMGTYNEEPIEWVVYKSSGDDSNWLLLSTYVLYNSKYILDENGSPLGSALLKDMNAEFCNSLFSEEEKNELSTWTINDEDSGYYLLLPLSSDLTDLFAEDADAVAIDSSGKAKCWWLLEKKWTDKDGTIVEDTVPYKQEGRVAGVRPVISVNKEYVASHLKDGVFSSENYKPTYSAYDTSNKKFTATVSQIQEDFADNTFELFNEGGAYCGVDPDLDYAATADPDFAEFKSSNIPGTVNVKVDYVQGEATLIPASDIDKAIPDIIWVNVTLSTLESNIVETGLKEIGAVFAALDPNLSTEEVYETLMNDIQKNTSNDSFTSEINGIPYYFSYDNGNMYVEVNNNER